MGNNSWNWLWNRFIEEVSEMSIFKNPYGDDYYAPYRYSFFKDGKKLGRIIHTKDVNGIYLDKCDEDWFGKHLI